MTDQELKDIVAAVVAELEKSGVDFDYKAEQAEDDDLVFVIRGTAPNYQGVTVTWKGLLDIITAQATQAKNDAETAKNAANTILEQVQSKGTEITNFVATSKAELETQKNESVNAVKSVYQTDLNELKGDLENAISSHIETQSASNNYYIGIETLSTEKQYSLIITVGTSGNYDIKLGTRTDSSAIVDTLATNYPFVANTPVTFDWYTPSAENISKVRISTNAVSWSVSVNEIIGAKQIAENKANITQNSNDIKDLQDFEGIVEENLLTEEPKTIQITIQTDGRYDPSGNFVSDTGRQYAIISPVADGEKYYLTTKLKSVAIPAIEYFNGNTFKSYEKLGTGLEETLTDYEITIPSGVNKIIVQSAFSSPAIVLKKLVYISKSYTKAEADARFESIHDGNSESKVYGIKWQISNNDDLGARCFDAVGMTATIGIGATDGSSDFDSVYPWSEIKRCNISKNANGAEIVTFEDETGFALDGTNGDVFVRVPKFYYERYKKDGYEYRTVSAIGTNVHPAFVEKGKELDAIYISAFEGYIGNDEKLHSYAGVIPTSNKVAQDFLNAAQANGYNYTLYDNRSLDALWTLIAVEFGCRNTNQIFGYGLADFEQPVNTYDRNKVILTATGTNTIRTKKWSSSEKGYMPVGSNITICDTTQENILTQAKITACTDGTDYTEWTFDGSAINVTTNCFMGSAAFNTNWCESEPSGALTYHTGRGNWVTNSTTRNPMRYRWIENLFGNLWHFLPDITFSGLQMYICDDMTEYVMHKKTAPYYPQNKVYTQQANNGSKADSTNVNYWVTDFDNGEFTKGIEFGRNFSQALTSVKAFGAYYYLYSDDVIIANGGGFDHLFRCNMLTQRAWIVDGTKWYLYGARLMYKHLR